MTMHKNGIGLDSQTLSSYDPLIWRKDANVMIQNFPGHLVLDSGRVGNSEKNVENMFWTNVYSRTRP